MTTLRLAIASILALHLLAACGGGSGGTGASAGGGTGGTGVSTAGVSTGVMTVGSIRVNGVRFDDSAAVVRNDDSAAPRTTADLKDGMVVKVRGRFNDDGVNGTAERVEIENEVRGTVQAVSATALPPFFTVIGQKVIVDTATVFANFAAAATPADRLLQLAAGTSFVEVHGQRDTAGNILASRVELFGGSALGDELRGIVTATPSASTFTMTGINSSTIITVNYGSAQIQPSGALVTIGTLVEVHGSFNGGNSAFTATRVDIEDLEDSAFQSTSGEKLEVEGFVTGFTAHPGNFAVGGRPVQTTATTRFEGGAAADLGNNVRVEAEGRVSGSTLVAEKISFRRTRVILTGVATLVNVVQRQVTVLGQVVQVNDLTDLRSAFNVGLQTQRLEIRAFQEASGALIAERLEAIGNSGGGKDIVQGRVTSEVGQSLAVLGVGTNPGVNANLSGAGVQFRDTNDTAISAATFFAAVTPSAAGGTLVKLKGTFNSAVLAVEEAELEN
jgi:hypothetical protein